MSDRDRIAEFRLKPCEHPECPLLRRADAASSVPRGPFVAVARAPAPAPALTPRQLAILPMLLQDLCNKEVAARCGISEKMAQAHRSNIYARFGVRGLSALTRAAVHHRLVAPVDEWLA